MTDLTAKKRTAFLSALAKGRSVSAACEAGSISRQTAYNWRREDPGFAEAWEQALEDGTDRLEDLAHERAEKGSDTLIIFLLKARRKEKYAGLERLRLTGPNDGPVQVETIEDTRPSIDTLMVQAAAKAEMTDV